MKRSEHLTCQLHLDCTINAGAASFSLHVEELDHGVGSIQRKQKIVRTASEVDFTNSSGASLQKCRIKKITDR